MASTKGTIVVRKEEDLLKAVKKILPSRAVMIIGEAGKVR